MKDVRNFVVSDLHGQGQIYSSIISTLEDEQRRYPNEKIVLYINGDIIDRGPNSIPMLLDVMDRVKKRKGNIEVKMLAGNHELIMLEAIEKKVNGKWNDWSTWFLGSNGGQVSSKQFDALPVSKQQEVIDFLENLPLNKVFDDPILGDRGVVIAHASAVDTRGIKTLKDILGNRQLSDVLWVRKKSGYNCAPVGRTNYLSIIGHTPTRSRHIEYDQDDNVLYIDCGCAKITHNPDLNILVPLVELNYRGNCLNVLHFDRNGKIAYTGMMKRNENGNLNNNVTPVRTSVAAKLKRKVSDSIDNIVAGVSSTVNRKNVQKHQKESTVKRFYGEDDASQSVERISDDLTVRRGVMAADLKKNDEIASGKILVKETETNNIERVEKGSSSIIKEDSNSNVTIPMTVFDNNSVFNSECIADKDSSLLSVKKITRNTDEQIGNVSNTVKHVENNNVSKKIILPSSRGIIVPESTIYIPYCEDEVSLLNSNDGSDIVNLYANFIEKNSSFGVRNLYVTSQSGLLIPRYDNSRYVISDKNPVDDMMANAMMSSSDYETIMSSRESAEMSFLKQYGYKISHN